MDLSLHILLPLPRLLYTTLQMLRWDGANNLDPGGCSSPSPSSRGQAQRRWMPLAVQLKPIPLLWHPNFSFSLLPQIQQQGTSSCQHDLTFLINPFLLLEWIDKQIKKCMAMLQCIQLNPEEKELHQSTTPAHGRQSGSNAEIHLLSGQIHRNTDRLNLQ
ncbi:uncharacterized protein [Lolium perenne]|uniref:uncharacterized protein isoform X2 n=1 Tax=Lolium perenne TaxID=4522 RepID=UPI003A99417E